VPALDGVDLDLSPGESVALLGPNGAGKTTLLGILAGADRASEGEVRAAPGRVGWVPQRPAVYGRLTARENLRLFAALEGRADPDRAAEDLIARADLGDVADRRADRLSTGTVQRLNLAVALAGEPAALLLDEPTATLSPEQRVRLWAWLGELRADRGLALIFSTQSVHEATRHADRLVVLAGGRVAFSGGVEELLAGAGEAEGDDDAAERAFLRLVEGR
jgi:ABC-2 type transport system ATP-binding protein